MTWRRMRPVLVAGAVVALDQAAKWLVRITFAREGDTHVMIPGFLNLCHVRNAGAAWGILSGWQSFLIVFSLGAMVLLVWRRHLLLGNLPWRWLVLGLLLGGISGNLIDRIWLGTVVDFIDFYWGRWHFPAFNVADSAICIGVGLFLLLQWREERRGKCGAGR
jgi:signal peptidase II